MASPPPPPPVVSRATRADVPAIASMIQELADFENESAANKATHAKLLSTIIFADDPPTSTPNPRKVAHCLLLRSSPAESPAGMALFFYNYSTWLAGPGVYLEDLYVRPTHRRRGYATVLFGALAEEVEKIGDGGEGRLEWSCLRWNENALKFYERIGGVRQEEWIGIRVQGKEKMEKLKEFAAVAASKGRD